MATINSSLATNTKVIALATGAEVDSSYLWAGADKTIHSEMQGKDNGDTIYFKTTSVGKASVTNATSQSALGTNNVKQSVVPVVIKDAKMAIKRNAVDAQITNEGEAVAKAKIGQKLAKAAVTEVISDDIKSIGNVFVDGGTSVFKTIQKACAYMKSITTGTIYGFMDWNVWGDLTGSGQQAVPCALAEARFGKDLKGSWALIDQLRVSGDIPLVTVPKITANAWKANRSADGDVHLFAAGTSDVTVGAGTMFTIPGIKAVDTMGNKTAKDFVFVIKTALTLPGQVEVGDDEKFVTLTAENSNVVALGDVQDGDVVASLTAPVDAGVYGDGETSANYFGLIMRTENAQCFGTLNECGCEGAKYSKSSIDNITVHENVESKIMGDSSDNGLTSFYRWDMMYASKLVEPRNAVLVLVKA